MRAWRSTRRRYRRSIRARHVALNEPYPTSGKVYACNRRFINNEGHHNLDKQPPPLPRRAPVGAPCSKDGRHRPLPQAMSPLVSFSGTMGNISNGCCKKKSDTAASSHGHSTQEFCARNGGLPVRISEPNSPPLAVSIEPRTRRVRHGGGQAYNNHRAYARSRLAMERAYFPIIKRAERITRCTTKKNVPTFCVKPRVKCIAYKSIPKINVG